MQNLGDAATHLLQNIDEKPIEYLLGSADLLKNISEEKPMAPFTDRTLEFLAAVSACVKQLGRGTGFQDITTFSFWLRKAHLNQLKVRYSNENEVRLGRGISLHFAPGNIPTQFAYTAVAGLLAGNCSVVRLSQKKTPQEQIIINAFQQVIEHEFPDFEGRILFVRYPHSKEITDMLSGICDVRVMWGSDESVNTIRQSFLKSGAVDLPFAARDSAAVFSAEAINQAEDLTALCRDFYNDTYLNDQNACSSPHILYWVGKESDVKPAKEKFWSAFEKILDEKQWTVQAETAVRKLTTACVAAVELEDIKIEKKDNRIVRLEIPVIDKQQNYGTTDIREESEYADIRNKKQNMLSALWNYSEPGGFFMELSGENFEGMLPVLGKKCQTVSTFGIDNSKFAEFVSENRAAGVDRIVPVGHTLDFELTWDGFNMIEFMSRKIYF